jgi:hypothetical protein
MAGAPTPTANGTFNGGINYGNANLPDPITGLPTNIFQGTGVNGLTQPTWYQPQTFTPTDITGQYDTEQAVDQAYHDLADNYYGGGNQFSSPNSFSSLFNAGEGLGQLQGLAKMYGGGIQNQQQDNGILNDLNVLASDTGEGYGNGSGSGATYQWLNNQTNQLANTENANVAGYDATNTTNANNAGYLQQAAIAQNQLLGELNQRGLLQSYLNGGEGTADMANLSNNLQNAQNDQGLGLQNELSGLQNSNQNFLMDQNQFQNALNNFSTQKSNSQAGLTDIFGLGAAAIPFVSKLLV